MERLHPTSAVRVCLADYANAGHASALVAVLDAYARDPMGGGEGLSAFARLNVVAGLASRPQAFSVLAFADSTDDQPVGLANCMEGFSTFACKPLINVHDLAVVPGFRGRGVGRQMLELVEHVARQRDACKLTLEVLEGNAGAIRLYRQVGFANYQLGDAMGNALFMQKYL